MTSHHTLDDTLGCDPVHANATGHMLDHEHAEIITTGLNPSDSMHMVATAATSTTSTATSTTNDTGNHAQSGLEHTPESDSSDASKNSHVATTFNQDRSCIVTTTAHNFNVYSMGPLTRKFGRRIAGMKLRRVHIYRRSNILAFTSEDPCTLYIYDDYCNHIISTTRYTGEIRGFCFTNDRLIVALTNSTFLYDVKTLTQVDHLLTKNNVLGLIATSTNDPARVAVPGETVGSVRIVGGMDIQAHNGSISCLALNDTGTRVATASDKGTLLRVFDTATGHKVAEFRRGIDSAVIHSLSFDATNSWLACCSSAGTLHVFSLVESSKNQRSMWAPFKDYLPMYVSSEWSFAQGTLPEEPCWGVFMPSSPRQQHMTIAVITASGSLIEYKFNVSTGGEVYQDIWHTLTPPA